MRAVISLLLCLVSPAAAAATFDQMRVYAMGGKSITTWHGQVDVHSINVELTHALSPRTEIGMTFAPMTVWQPRNWFGYDYGNGNEKVLAISAAFLARRTFNTGSPSVQFYGEGAIGPMWAQKRVPAATSRFNVVTQVGAGFIFRPHSRFPILAGYRFQHISNGGYAPRNPGLNVSAAVLGVQFRR